MCPMRPFFIYLGFMSGYSVSLLLYLSLHVLYAVLYSLCTVDCMP